MANEYQSLIVFNFNHHDPEALETEYQARLNGYATTLTGMVPTLMDPKSESTQRRYPIFYVQTVQINQLLERMRSLARRISGMVDLLPDLAKMQYRNKLIIDEIYNTNKIENIHTDIDEIGTTLESVQLDTAKGRFYSTVNMYMKMTDGYKPHVEHLRDIRNVYDDVISKEIDSDLLPDGNLFRSRQVRIGTTTKTYHVPPTTEHEINDQLEQWITFINGHELDYVPKAIIAHFMFENTHPFYDGNGRIGRFLLSSYLAAKLDTLTGLTVSTGISENQAKYYKAFQTAGDSRNRADLTLFVRDMLQIIITGQQQALEFLADASEKFEDLLGLAEQVAKGDEIAYALMSGLIQSKLFVEEQKFGIKDAELIEMVGAQFNNHSRVKQTLQKLEDDGVVSLVARRPKQHVISL
jgi:Fic family protein